MIVPDSRHAYASFVFWEILGGGVKHTPHVDYGVFLTWDYGPSLGELSSRLFANTESLTVKDLSISMLKLYNKREVVPSEPRLMPIAQFMLSIAPVL